MRYYFFREWRANLRARPLVTIVVVLLAATGVAGTTILRFELSRALTWWENRFEQPLFEIYLDAAVAEDSAVALSAQLSALDQVQQAEYISATQAQREAEEYLGAIVFSILPQNPLPASVRLVIAPEFRTPHHVQKLTDSLAETPGITEVVSADRQVAIYSAGKGIITSYSTVLLAAALGWTIFWLFTGVFLIVRLRSPRWKVYQHLGAQPGWFRWPSMAEGFALGVCSSVAALLFTRLAVKAGWLPGGLPGQSGSELLAVLLVPAVIGCLAGWLAYRVQRHRGAIF